jgi:hypothetical protein
MDTLYMFDFASHNKYTPHITINTYDTKMVVIYHYGQNRLH